jgi:Mu transposase-like protein
MITDGQVRKLFQDLQSDKPLAVAARRAGMDEKTARKYRTLGALPSSQKRPRTYRTRKDPLAELWQKVQQRLEAEPRLHAKTLFDWLLKEYPGQLSQSQRRTFERRVRRWRATSGKARTVMFSQVHHAGDLAASDFTSMNTLGVTILGKRFEHMVYHFVLTYSNWEAVTICASESFEALSDGLQNALWELGGVPRRHRSDSLSAAVNNLSAKREFQSRYRGLLDHYGLAGERINVRQPHENGDSESSHGHFKTAVDQALHLRGSRDFNSRDEYGCFLKEVVVTRNAPRRQRHTEELAMLGPLPAQRQDSCLRLPVRVDTGSLIHIHRNTYSVHSRLIGQEVEARLHAERVEIWYGGTQVDTLPRLVGRDKHAINYRHIIDQLVRKPGAFDNYRYREDLFPNSRFRIAYDRLQDEHAADVARRAYLRILQHAAHDSESAVDDALRCLLAQEQPLSAEAVIALARIRTQLPAATDVCVEAPDLRSFDDLLAHKEVYRVEESYTRADAVGDGQPPCPVLDHVAAGDPDGLPEAIGPTFVASAAGRSDNAVERTTQGSAIADIPRTVPDTGGASDAGGLELPPISGGAGQSRMPNAEPQPGPAPVAQLAIIAGQDVGAIPLVASAIASGAATTEPARRDLPGPTRELAGVRQTGLWKDAFVGGAWGATGPARPLGAVCPLQLVGSGVAGSQTRIETGTIHQTAGGLRGFDHRRLGLCAAEPGGDGGVVHVVGGTLRARQRSVDQQPAVLAVGADLQGPNDNRGGHRSFGASQRDYRVEHNQLPLGDRQENAANSRRGDPFADCSLTLEKCRNSPGILIVAKEEI